MNTKRQSIAEEDWNFSRVPDNELVPCLFSGDWGAGFPPWAASGGRPRRESLLRRI